ncbi:MAG: pyridine nucleotide-disulfide oxidoreductase [Micrococcales bacterium]|nr:MAG: pyridine nucleotide-disulfide oxidoreductase [Micrococcales bacterium]
MVTRHDIVVVGAGTAGNSVASRLHRAGARDIAVVDPWSNHYYQPLWTLVGGGVARVQHSARPREKLLPKGSHWIKKAANGVDPEQKLVHLDDGTSVGYGQLVMVPGIQLDWDKIPGLRETLGKDGVSSNYRFDLAPLTWDFIQQTHSGTAVFTMPSGPIKCAGAPQKIAYLACDYWRKQGVLKNIDVHLVIPTPAMFGIPKFADILKRTADDYGITVHFESEMVEVDASSRKATIRKVATAADAGQTEVLDYDFMHATPPQSAPDWVKASPLAGAEDPFGYVEVNKHTLQHVRYPDVFSLGDVGNTPNSKTGAAIRKQAPVAAKNMLSAAKGEPLRASYNGYASCPLTLSRKWLLLAEFDYAMQPTPSNPLPWPDTTEPVIDYNLFKRVGLPVMYWNLMLKGLA